MRAALTAVLALGLVGGGSSKEEVMATEHGMETIYASFGLKIRRIREALGIDQAAMGKRVGLTRTSVNNLEAGRQRVQLHQVEKWAIALGTSPKHLLRGIWF